MSFLPCCLAFQTEKVLTMIMAVTNLCLVWTPSKYEAAPRVHMHGHELGHPERNILGPNPNGGKCTMKVAGRPQRSVFNRFTQRTAMIKHARAASALWKYVWGLSKPPWPTTLTKLKPTTTQLRVCPKPFCILFLKEPPEYHVTAV